ncbi:hypothetical protein GCM10009717_01880 [Agromyces allii]|uniref:Flagellar protein FlgN n=1 Tax=Agromyces allii TaxID=393607 RepID=A0ABN2Q2C1_9MICO
MVLDSYLSPAMAQQLRAAGVSRHQVDRTAFFADVAALELRLAIIDDRFERLACRPDGPYQDWRRDTLTKVRAIASRARVLEEARDLEAHHRRRVAALLMAMSRRLESLDVRHAAFGDRRARSAANAKIGRALGV